VVSAKRRTTRGTPCAAAGLLIVLVGCGRPPQLGADDDVFKTVDALFTAVTARDEKLLDDCGQRLRSFQEAGRLPADASEYLDAIIEQARDGRWEPAAEKLYHFMKAQRRQGTRSR